MKLKLRAIKYLCDFRKSDFSLYQEFRRSKGFPGELKTGECYLFVSSGENQLIWFLNTSVSENSQGWEMTFSDSRRWRFSGSNRWDPARLTHYAEAVGIVLLGIRSFEAAYEERREARLEEAHRKRVRAARAREQLNA